MDHGRVMRLGRSVICCLNGSEAIREAEQFQQRANAPLRFAGGNPEHHFTIGTQRFQGLGSAGIKRLGVLRAAPKLGEDVPVGLA